MTIVRRGPFCDSPHVLLRVQIRRVWWQKAEFDFVDVLGNPSRDGLGVVISRVVNYQENFAPLGVRNQPLDEFQKAILIEAF
jgi:hypothetical protein